MGDGMGLKEFLEKRYNKLIKEKIKIERIKGLEKAENIVKISGCLRILFIFSELNNKELRISDIVYLSKMPQPSVTKAVNHLYNNGILQKDVKIAEEGPRKEKTSFYRLSKNGEKFLNGLLAPIINLETRTDILYQVLVKG